MSDDFMTRLGGVNELTLTPLVRRALADADAQVTDWQIDRFGGGYASSTVGAHGTFRFAGSARSHGEDRRWSLVLKAMGNSSGVGSNRLADWHYWKREILAYQSGILADLSGPFGAPRCFGVVEHPGDEFWIWLEELRDTVGDRWPIEQYARTARHLGEFNGAYLAGRPLPAQPWLTTGRVRNWLDLGEPVLRDLRAFVDNATRRHWLSGRQIDRVIELWRGRERLLSAIEHLPRTFCHHDAFRRNLFAQRDADGLDRTVAIDWQIVGTGAIGEDAMPLIAVSLQFMNVSTDWTEDLEGAVLDGYVCGLRDGGWQGSTDLARLGYAISGGLLMGAAMAGMWTAIDAEVATIIGHPVDEVLDTFARLQEHYLNVADKARVLLDLA